MTVGGEGEREGEGEGRDRGRESYQSCGRALQELKSVCRHGGTSICRHGGMGMQAWEYEYM